METIGLLGGTGDIGRALAVNLAKKYDRVLLGSRSRDRAEKAVGDILSDKGDRPELKNHLFPETNDQVIFSCNDLILTVPNNAAVDTVKSLSGNFRNGQLLLSAVANIGKQGKEFVPVRNPSSISKAIQELVPTVEVATAFQTLPAHILYSERGIDADVLVSCDRRDTFDRASGIISSIQRLRPLYAGSLELSSEVEGLTALLLNVAISNRLKNPTLKFLSF